MDSSIAVALEFEKRLVRAETTMAVLDERSVQQGATLKRIEEGQARVLGASLLAAVTGICSLGAFIITHTWH